MGPVGFPVAAALAVELLVGWCRLWDDLGTLECGDSVGEECHEDQEVKEDFDELAVHLVCHPLIHLVVHQVHWHRIEDDDDESHDEDKDTRNHVVSKEAAEQAVTEHAHCYSNGFCGNYSF